MFSCRFALFLFFFSQLPPAQAQKDLPAAQPAQSRELSITFVPPPFRGKITMGVFSAEKKLVRLLHREATEKDFTVGLNGLITQWDGNDETGAPAPAGAYFVRGWMIGDLKIEGVAFHCNEWAVADVPRSARVTQIQSAGRDEVRVALRNGIGEDEVLAWNLSKKDFVPNGEETAFEIADGRLSIKGAPIELGDGVRAISGVSGFAGNVWVIVETADGREARAYTPAGEFLRRLSYARGEPPPTQIAASRWSETVFLLDENPTLQRLRALSLTEKDGVPVWNTTYQKQVVFSPTWESVASMLGRAEAPKTQPVLKIKSRANPLLQNQRTQLEMSVQVTENGVLLKTMDGLPIAQLSRAKGLKWAVLVHENQQVLLFQSDGLSVEEFIIGRPDNLMEFDAGQYELRK